MMARMIRHEATSPCEIKPDPEGRSAWICMCGLSQNYPHCDGAHKIARQGEEAGKLYFYDTDRTQVTEVQDETGS